MVSLASLLLPILLSAVAVFLVSSIIHMLLPYHRTDFERLPNEEQVLAALRPFSLPPGDYMFPTPPGRDFKSPEYAEKLQRGPVGLATIMPVGPFRMGGQLAAWFAYCLVVSLVAAYVASRALEPGADYLAVFRFAGVTAFAAYGLALWQNTIWFKRKWSTTLKSNFDALIYALLTAGIFGWLWPV